MNARTKEATGFNQTHMSIHEGIKYECDQCGHKAARKGDLKRHKMSVHEGVKYQCNQCDYEASRQGNLKSHKVLVHENVEYQ